MTEISISIPASAQPSGKAVFVMLGTGFDEIEARTRRCHATCRDGGFHRLHDR